MNLPPSHTESLPDACHTAIFVKGAETVLGFCAWHNGWFDRQTGEPVKCDDKPESHGICPRCTSKMIDDLNKMNRR